jgi:hypothetical protein
VLTSCWWWCYNSDYEVISTLGHGSFGKVKRAFSQTARRARGEGGS